MIYTDLLKNVWNSIYDPKKEVIEIIDKFFHQDYEQCINGVIMNRSEYIHHVLEQRQNMKVDAIEYKHVLEKGNELFCYLLP